MFRRLVITAIDAAFDAAGTVEATTAKLVSLSPQAPRIGDVRGREDLSLDRLGREPSPPAGAVTQKPKNAPATGCVDLAGVPAVTEAEGPIDEIDTGQRH